MLSLVLPLIVIIPLVAGVGLLIARRCCLTDRAGERIGLLTAVILLVLSILAGFAVETAGETAQGGSVIAPNLEFAPAWFVLRLPSIIATNSDGWQLSLGLDSIGLSMIVLTSLVTLPVLLIARTTVTHDRSDFAAWTLFAVSGLMLVFTSMDLILFYVGFELVLIPLFALIAFWGDHDAGLAAKRFVLYTLAGSIPMVLGLLGIAQLYAVDSSWTVYLPELSARAAAKISEHTTLGTQAWIFGFLVFGLGIKMALLPLHTWLPKTYGSCHPTVAAFLAAVVLKLGLFGFVRLALPMVPLACERYGPTVMASLGAAAIVVGALMALVQTDLRRLLGYSSLSHVGFVTMGLFALNEEGLSGGILQMFNHGITTAAVFLAAACVITRRGTARLGEGNGGLANRCPKLSAFMFFFLVAGAGMPGLNNFVGEMLTLMATVAAQPIIAGIATLGIILGAWYSFRLIRILLFGRDTVGRSRDDGGSIHHSDLNVQESFVFGLLAAICLTLGVYPQAALNSIQRDAGHIADVCNPAENSRLAFNFVEQNP